MLLPVTIALGIAGGLGFTAYAFRREIARWIGKTHKQVRMDLQEIKEEYKHGRKY